MGQISIQNSAIRLVHEFLARGRKCSLTTRTREEQRMGANPFRILLVSPGPTYAQNMSLIGESHLGTFPRKIFMFMISANSLQDRLTLSRYSRRHFKMFPH